MKIVQTDNIAAHYRAPIYVKIAGSEGSGEREDGMSEVKDNIRPGVGEGWSKVGAARCEKCWLEKRIEDAEKVG